MRNVNRVVIVLLGALVLTGATVAFGQDWPQWRGANRDGKVSGFAAPGQWPGALVQVWKETVGAGDATPALVGDRLYVFVRQGDDEVTLCLNAADGKQVWENRHAADAVSGAAARHPGPRSSPAVAQGKVVTLGVAGVLSCLNAADGKLVWRKDEFPKVVPQFYTASSPLIVDGMVVAQLGGRGNGAIMAFDLAGGDVKWKLTGQVAAYSSPVLMTVEDARQVVAMTEKSVVGVGLADGKLLWEIPFVPGRRAYNAATPIVDGQTVIFTGAARGTKAVRVEKQGDGFAVRELWSNPELAVQYNTPVLKDGLLFGLTDGGSLFCIDAGTGKTGWTDAARHGRGFAAIVDAGPVVMALPSTSELIVYKPDAQAYTELAKIKVADKETYAHPVVAGNRIFIKDQDALTLFTIR